MTRRRVPPVHWRLSLAAVALAWAALAAVAADPPALPQAPAELRVLTYNIYNYAATGQPSPKSAESKAMVAAILAKISPDVAVLIETSGAQAVAELAAAVKANGVLYPFATVVEGFDQERRIAMLAKMVPLKIEHDTTSFYNLGGKHMRVQRGFGHVVFAWANGYRLHVVAAHLKSKMYDPMGQTDMRRYEARQLRYLVDAILKAETHANILVLGDLNDTPESSPLNTLCSRRSGAEKQLFDLRPEDKANAAWTHLWDVADTYSRIDYALVSYGLLPEVVLAKTQIPDIPDWYIASDHRPVLVTLTPKDLPPPGEQIKHFDRNIRQPVAPPSSFHDGQVVGSRKARKDVAGDMEAE